MPPPAGSGGQERSGAAGRARERNYAILRPEPPPPGLYDRARDLPKLLALWPWELPGPEAARDARIIAKLREALRAERRRGAAGHWTYDLVRHAQLLAAYRAETGARGGRPAASGTFGAAAGSVPAKSRLKRPVRPAHSR